jgi:hypothetical protein
VAKLGMKEHSSQTDAFVVKSHGTYDNAKFGLYFTTVGEDVAKDDFLEHIDPDASANYLAEHAAEIEAQKAAAAAELAAAAENARALPEEAPEDEAPENDAAEEAPEAETGEEAAWEDAEAPSADGDDAGEVPEQTAQDAATGGMEEAGTDEAGETDVAEDATTEAGGGETPDGPDENAVSGQPGIQAAGQLLGAAEPAVVEERAGNTLLPVLMIGAGVAAIGVGAWYGWRYMQGQKRRRRRRKP